MTPSQIREKPVKPAAPRRDLAQPTMRTTIVTRAELADCTCPEHCERDHDDG